MPHNPSAGVEPWPDGLAHDLEHPQAFPASAQFEAPDVEVVQTHLSRVYLVGDRVYKLPRPVDLGFVSFARRAERARECRREVELNRRLAPDVYLGVAPLTRVRGRYRVGSTISAPGELPTDVEHCIVMRRLDDDRNALALLMRGALEIGDVQRLARRLARFHSVESLGTPAPFSPSEWRTRNTEPLLANFEALERASGDFLPDEAVRRLRADSEDALARHADRFEARRRAGRAVDAHGDLHLQHIWFESDDREPIAIDGLVFREDLRRIDQASEMAFLAMDLRYRGRADLAEHLLGRYAAARDDFDLYSVVDLYTSYRAAVRAKVAALAALDPEIEVEQRHLAAESARRHLAAAVESLARPGAGPLVLVCGTVGSGKSTLARSLAERTGVPIVSSDAVRPHVVGERDGLDRWGAPRYSEAARHQVYDAVRERVRPVLASGRPAILDATFAHHSEREATLALASEMDSSCHIVEARCSRDVALERLARRSARGDDDSEAGPGHLDASQREFEPIAPPNRASHDVVETDHPEVEVDALVGALSARLFGAGVA